MLTRSSRILFWSVDQLRYYMKDNYEDRDTKLAHAEKRQVGPEDMKLLKEALTHA